MMTKRAYPQCFLLSYCIHKDDLPESSNLWSPVPFQGDRRLISFQMAYNVAVPTVGTLNTRNNALFGVWPLDY